MNIRRMTLDDIPQVAAIDKASFSLPWPERSFRFEVTDNPASRAWVVEWDGKITGMIVVWLLVGAAHIATIATHPDYRRQGIASRLLIHASQSLKEEGAVHSVLEVRESNTAAQAMYPGFGFVESGRRTHYYRDNDEDAILMSLPALLSRTAKSFMEKGQLVPDEITIKMVLDKLASPDCANGVILDGFPRNLKQAEALDKALASQKTGKRKKIGELLVESGFVSEDQILGPFNKIPNAVCQVKHHDSR